MIKKTAIIIPARYQSTRLPGKPLLSETGKPLIQHTWEQAIAVKGDNIVLVATDDQRIADTVKAFGGEAVMTSPDHSTGSARVAEAVHNLDVEIIINIQGDEPEIDPDLVEKLIKLQSVSGSFASTVACPFPLGLKKGPGSPDDPAAVKVITREVEKVGLHKAIYFSRQKLPYSEDNSKHPYFMHLGIYGFNINSVQQFAVHNQTPLEKSENLEQLRILEMGEDIAVLFTDQKPPGIDTPEDYRAFVARMRK